MKSNEEFIAGIYRKAEAASRMEIEKTEQRAKLHRFTLPGRAALLAAAAACLVLVIQMGRRNDSAVNTEQDAGLAPQIAALSEDIQDSTGLTDDAGSSEASGAAFRMLQPAAEYRVSVKLLKTENIEAADTGGMILFYEVLEVLQAPEEGEVLQAGESFSLTLSAADLAWCYPDGTESGSTQILQLYTEEDGWHLIAVEEDGRKD